MVESGSQPNAPHLLIKICCFPDETGCLTFPESCFHALGKYFISFSSMSKNVCSLSGMEKDNQETSTQTKTIMQPSVKFAQQWDLLFCLLMTTVLMCPFSNSSGWSVVGKLRGGSRDPPKYLNSIPVEGLKCVCNLCWHWSITLSLLLWVMTQAFSIRAALSLLFNFA